MSARPARTTKSLLIKSAELAVATPQVVAHRLARMAVAGPALSARDRKEFERMSAEKMAAFNESWSAMADQALHAQRLLAASWVRSFWPSALKGRRPSATAMAVRAQNAAMGILGKGMAPVHRKAVANAKRLARTRLR